MGDYPETITLDPDSSEYKFMKAHSALFDTLAEMNNGPLEVSADLLFHGDEEKWKNFVDIFFPNLTEKQYFGFRNNNIYVLPERGGTKSLTNMLDYLMVNSPNTMLNFARSQARKYVAAPANKVAKGVGIRTPGSGALAYLARKAAARANNNNFQYGNNNTFGRYNNEERQKNTRPEVRVNNNANYNNEENEENVRIVPSNTTRFGKSSARGPLLNFSQLLARAPVKKTKKKKGGSRKMKQRRRMTYRK
jgi:hypothetical protein